MPTQGDPRGTWAFINLLVNVARLVLMLWAVFHGPGSPMVHQLTFILVRSATTVIIFVWQGVFY
ncbi:hypothetical protein [Arthrobacter sp. MAHUQ-56]